MALKTLIFKYLKNKHRATISPNTPPQMPKTLFTAPKNSGKILVQESAGAKKQP